MNLSPNSVIFAKPFSKLFPCFLVKWIQQILVLPYFFVVLLAQLMVVPWFLVFFCCFLVVLHAFFHDFWCVFSMVCPPQRVVWPGTEAQGTPGPRRLGDPGLPPRAPGPEPVGGLVLDVLGLYCRDGRMEGEKWHVKVDHLLLVNVD